MQKQLTRKQATLLRELNDLAEVLGMDYQSIQEYEPEARTAKLQVMKRDMIRGQIIVWYTLIDEALNINICHIYFGKNRKFNQLWRTKRFTAFNHHILENMYPLQKLHLVCEFQNVPKSICDAIRDLNTVRNGLAHNFFFENAKRAKLTWKGENIMNPVGVKLFVEDMNKIHSYFFKTA